MIRDVARFGPEILARRPVGKEHAQDDENDDAGPVGPAARGGGELHRNEMKKTVAFSRRACTSPGPVLSMATVSASFSAPSPERVKADLPKVRRRDARSGSDDFRAATAFLTIPRSP